MRAALRAAIPEKPKERDRYNPIPERFEPDPEPEPTPLPPPEPAALPPPPERSNPKTGSLIQPAKKIEQIEAKEVTRPESPKKEKRKRKHKHKESDIEDALKKQVTAEQKRKWAYLHPTIYSTYFTPQALWNSKLFHSEKLTSFFWW